LDVSLNGLNLLFSFIVFHHPSFLKKYLKMDKYFIWIKGMLHRKKKLLVSPILLMLLSQSLCFAGDNRTDKTNPDRGTEAPPGFDSLTTGLVDQATFDDDKLKFQERDTIQEGLGPIYNAESCSECHQNPVTGSASQHTVVRSGFFDGKNFIEPTGGSLIPDRAIDASIQAHVSEKANVTSLRVSLSTLGDGFIEAIADETLLKIAAMQPKQSGGDIHGETLLVDLLEAPGSQRIGRFGWKGQHASLLSFSADAYRNEMGITTPLAPTEGTSNGRSVDAFDTVPDPEDTVAELDMFTEFMRATKVPPRDTQLAASESAKSGERIFDRIGCGICHVATLTTVSGGTVINGGTYTVPPALGNKIIHPYSDLLLHDVGTGDGIVQNGGPTTRNKIRTPPLWGLRTRGRLLHDGSALSIADAIKRHSGEATNVSKRYVTLSSLEKAKLRSFLNSL
jgi:CxxC motif-containing protein (DUF1111 family)